MCEEAFDMFDDKAIQLAYQLANHELERHMWHVAGAPGRLSGDYMQLNCRCLHPPSTGRHLLTHLVPSRMRGHGVLPYMNSCAC